MKLTKSSIERMKYEKEPVLKNGKTTYPRDIRWDDSLPSFGVRVYPSGRRVYIVYFRVTGRQRLMVVGKTEFMSLEKARKKAKQILLDAGEGKDAMADRTAKRQAKNIKDLCHIYMERHARHKKTGKEDLRRLDKHIVPRWGQIKVEALTSADVERLHTEISNKAPYEANRVVSLLATLFNLAMEWNLTSPNHQNPAAKVKFNKEVKRDRWVRPDELPQLVEAIDMESNPYVRALIWLFLLTGARKGELLAAKWEHLDWDQAILTFPETKSGRTHYLPLSEPALAILRSLPRLEDNPYIFPGRIEGEPIVNLDKAWRRLRKTAKLNDVRIHDLRRTVGSWIVQAGNTPYLVQHILNHKDVKTTAIYARFAQDHVRKALEDHSERMMKALRGKTTE